MKQSVVRTRRTMCMVENSTEGKIREWQVTVLPVYWPEMYEAGQELGR